MSNAGESRAAGQARDAGQENSACNKAAGRPSAAQGGDTFRVRLADFVFQVTCGFPDTRKLCAGYLTDDAPDYSFAITPDDIAYEDEKSVREALYEGLPVVRFLPGYLESTSVYRHIAEWVSHRGAAVFHGALVELDGRGYLFTAKSGTGKTTHVSNWLKAFPDARIVNGDKPILRVMDDCVMAYGTPWCGKEGWNENESVRLAAIVVLERSDVDEIAPIAMGDATGVLVGQTYRAADGEGLMRALQFVASLQDKVGLYRLGCTMDVNSARIAYEGIN